MDNQGFIVPSVGAFDAPTVGLRLNMTWAGYVIGAVSKLARLKAWQGDESAVDDVIQTVEQILNALALGNLMEVPVGAIMEYAGSTAPDKWLVCDGSTVDEADYPELATVLTPVAGIITLPDFRGRVPVGVGQGIGLTVNHVLLEMIGEEDHALTIDEMPTHEHNLRVRRNAVAGASERLMTYGGTAGTDGISAGAIDTEGDGIAHNNMQPSLAVNFIIRVEA